jgi:hypothetical protein
LDRAWFIKKATDPHQLHEWKALGNIECMLLQRIHNLYVASDYSQKYQLVNMGKLTVDLKHMKLFVTIDKNNVSQYMLVM